MITEDGTHRTLFDERLIADPQIGAEVVAGARSLALHRMVQGHGSHWDALSEHEKLSLCTEASIVIAAADRSRAETTNAGLSQAIRTEIAKQMRLGGILRR